MLNKLLYIILGALIIGNVIVGYQNVKAVMITAEVRNEVLTKTDKMPDNERRFVLPVNEDKEFTSKEEIRTYFKL